MTTVEHMFNDNELIGGNWKFKTQQKCVSKAPNEL